MNADHPANLPAVEPRVLIVSDDPLARAGISMLLSAHAPAMVVGQIGARDDLAGSVQLYQPDAVLWDLGADARVVSERLAEVDNIAVAVVALLPDDTYASDAAAAGIRGVLLRDASGAQIVTALRAVANGLTVFDPALASAIVPSRERATPRISDDLTAREIEVLQLLSAGLANKTIAARLGISDHTVKFHVNAILSKLGVQSRTEAVVRAVRLGLVIL